MFILNGQSLSPDRAFTHNGIQYPANWLRLSTLEEKTAIGITEKPDEIPHDQRYYWGYDQEGKLIPKQLEDETVTPEEGEPYTTQGLKSQHIAQNKQTANTLLAPTDWYVIRKLERDIDIPENIVAYRTAVIQVATEREALIEAVTSVEELKGLYETLNSNSPAMPNWPSLNN